jgi:hypothetical protein
MFKLSLAPSIFSLGMPTALWVLTFPSHSNIVQVSQFVNLLLLPPPSRSYSTLAYRRLGAKCCVMVFNTCFGKHVRIHAIRTISYLLRVARSWLQRLLSYVMGLIFVLNNLFSTALTSTWVGLQWVYGDYEWSSSRQSPHDTIL